MIATEFFTLPARSDSVGAESSYQIEDGGVVVWDDERPDGVVDSLVDDDVYSVTEQDTNSLDRYLAEPLLDLTGVTPHRSFDELEFSRWKLGQALAAKLLSVGQDSLAAKLKGCHQSRTTAICDGCGKRVSFYNRCDIFWCPQCSPRLSKIRLDGLMFFVEKMRQPKHIVLTFRNTDNLTDRYITEAKKALTKFRRRKFFSGCRSGLWAMEITNKGKGWHLHFHLVVDVSWLPVRELSDIWRSCTNDNGHIVWIEDASRGSLRANLPRYVTKYTGKGFSLHEWDADMLAQFVTAIEKQRTFGVFGELLGARREWSDWLKTVRESRRKCECGCCSKKYFSDRELEWRDNFTGFDRTRVAAASPPRVAQYRWTFVSNRT